MTASTNKQSADVIVIGAGIFGLWAARHAIKAGKSVQVIEKDQVGAGASGGFLGALMPHMPDRWNPKKEMQFQALRSIGDAIAELEADTGSDCGFRRCGRLMPLKHEGMVRIANERIAGAEKFWVDEDQRQLFRMERLEQDFAGTIADGWLSEKTAPFGATFDTLSARVNPRKYIGALAAFVRDHGKLVEGEGVLSIDPDTTSIRLHSGEALSAGEIVVANGWRAYDLLGGMGARHGGRPVTGRGVKGQAVLLQHEHGDDLPILYDNGSYIIPHAGRHDGGAGHDLVAIGSSSVNDWADGAGDDDRERLATCHDDEDEAFLEHALALAPSLASAPVIERWANVRPRNTMADLEMGKVTTDPLFGSLDGHPSVRLAIGGFKISFGIGHLQRQTAHLADKSPSQ